MAKCRLCTQEKELLESHIFPRAYFKHLKRRSPGGQLVEIPLYNDDKPKKTNYNPKEPLFCKDCEAHLSDKMEKYGTRLLKESWNQTKNKRYVTFERYDYRTLFFYLVSILWRAAISSLPEFETVYIGENIEEILRTCILSGTLGVPGMKCSIDSLIRISLIRLVEVPGKLNQETIDHTFQPFAIAERNNDALQYYFLVDGYLVTYLLSKDNDLRRPLLKGELRDDVTARFPKRRIDNFFEIALAVNKVVEKNRKFGPIK